MISKRSLSNDNVRDRRGGNRSKNNSAHVVRRCRRILLRKQNHPWTVTTALLVLVIATTLLGRLYWHLAVESFRTRNHDADSAAVDAAHHHPNNNHRRPFQDGDSSSSDGAQQVVLSNDNVGSVRRATQQQNQPRPRPTTEQVVWILETALGRLRINLRPDLSPESVAYVQAVVTAAEKKGGCPLCRFYRAEKPGIFQGILPSDTVPLPAVHGNCPYNRNKNDTTNQKENNDPCHGPIMTRGMVGWAGGLLGPDFFIDSYPRPAEWWGTQHTGMLCVR